MLIQEDTFDMELSELRMYPEYFTEESPKINLDYLLKWPALHKRASYIAGYAIKGGY